MGLSLVLVLLYGFVFIILGGFGVFVFFLRYRLKLEEVGGVVKEGGELCVLFKVI